MKRPAGALLVAALLVPPGCARLPVGAPPNAWELPPPPPAVGPLVPSERLHRAVLENGMQLVVLEDPRLPRVLLGVTVAHGSAELPAERAGLAVYTAELQGRGAGKRDARAFSEAVESLGASFDSSSDWDATEVALSGLARDQGALLDLLADAVLRPRFDAVEAERLRSQTLASLQRIGDDPDTLVRQQLARTLFPGHPWGELQSGTPETVARFDAAAARRAHAALWRPGEAIFFAAGDVARADVERRVRDLFGGWKPAAEAPSAPPPPQPPAARRVVVVDKPELGQAVIAIGHEGIPRAAPERIAVQLMNVVLGGGGFSSRIMSRIRESEGLAYYAQSGFAMRRTGGVFAASTATRVPRAGDAVAMLLEEIERARLEPPTPEEVGHARTLASGRFALGLETSDALVSSLVELEIYGLPRDSLDRYRERVRDTPLAEIQAAGREKLHPERAAVVVVGPAEQLRPQLERFGPVEVVKP